MSDFVFNFQELSPKGGYGVLIATYLKVLLAKLEFHHKVYNVR